MATKTVVSSEADNPDDPNTQYVNVYSDGTTDTSSSPLEIGSTVGSADSSSSSSSSSSDSGPKIVNSFTAKDGSTVSEMSDGTYQQDGKTIDEATYNQLNTETANANETSSVAGSGAPSNNPLANLGTQIQNLLKGGGLGSAATTAGLAALAKGLMLHLILHQDLYQVLHQTIRPQVVQQIIVQVLPLTHLGLLNNIL